MRINRTETFSIENLSKEEFLFLLEVIDQLQLTDDSPPDSLVLAQKFKDLRSDIFPDPLVCDGCEVTEDVTLQECPIQKEKLPLCDKCYSHRTALEPDRAQEEPTKLFSPGTNAK